MARKAAATKSSEHASGKARGRKRSPPNIESGESTRHAQGAKATGASTSPMPGIGDVAKIATVMTLSSRQSNETTQMLFDLSILPCRGLLMLERGSTSI